MISIIAATDLNGVIGKDNDMPWGRLPVDLKHFKEKTMGKTIVMGRKTYESIGKKLPGRKTIVLSRGLLFINGIMTVSSIDEILEYHEKNKDKELFIIGGGQLYEKMLPYADKIYLTTIFHSFDGDTYFPSVDFNDWKLLSREYSLKDKDNKYNCVFEEWVK